mmetsp:Transcript_40911/g.47041  ORF Transcript_40911/g.47041 Transcript_40911/m.47041 type:complete len:91 (+) Transcript_40911:190-462(+)
MLAVGEVVSALLVSGKKISKDQLRRIITKIGELRKGMIVHEHTGDRNLRLDIEKKKKDETKATSGAPTPNASNFSVQLRLQKRPDPFCSC